MAIIFDPILKKRSYWCFDEKPYSLTSPGTSGWLLSDLVMCTALALDITTKVKH